jgi:SnoaL-like domain
MDDRLIATLHIREVVDNWVIFRDSGNWPGFGTVWHDDGWMTATWFQGPAAEFIEASRAGLESGVNILHFLGGSSVEVSGSRAVAQTKMTIQQRAPVEGVEVEVTCTGRFYDFFEERAGRWAIVRRQPIYEKDRMDVLDPSASVRLDRAVLERFPVGYRHLAYLQQAAGHVVMHGLPGLRGPEVELLYAEGARWLAGADRPGVPLAGHRGVSAQ